MDYEIKPASRHDLRLYSKLFRSVCGFAEDEPIDPVSLLDRLPDLEGFEDVRYEIVYNNIESITKIIWQLLKLVITRKADCLKKVKMYFIFTNIHNPELILEEKHVL